MKGIHPVILGFVRFIPHILGLIAIIFFAVVFVADVIITVITINNLTKRVKLMNDIAKKIHNVSDEVGEHIYDGANDIMKKGIEIYNSENVQEIRENLDDMSIATRMKLPESVIRFMQLIWRVCEKWKRRSIRIWMICLLQIHQSRS